MNKKQVAYLKDYILADERISDITKKFLWLLIDKSDNLTKYVSVSFIEKKDNFTKKRIEALVKDVSILLSGSQSINIILRIADIGVILQLHYGDFDPKRNPALDTSGQFPGLSLEHVKYNKNPERLILKGQPFRYTFWLHPETFVNKPKKCLNISLKEIQNVVLTSQIFILNKF